MNAFEWIRIRVHSFTIGSMQITALVALATLLIFPQIGFSADVVGGAVEVLEPGVVEVGGEEAHELGDLQPGDAGDMGAQEIDTSAYDLILEVPVQVENLYPIITRFKVTCWVGKRLGEDGSTFVEGTVQDETVAVDIENGTYGGTFRYFFTLLPDQTTDDVNLRMCKSWIWNSENTTWHMPTMIEDADYPAWRRVGDGSHHWGFQSIEW